MLLHLIGRNLQADGLARRGEIDGLMDNRYILSRMDTCGDIEWLQKTTSRAINLSCTDLLPYQFMQ